jgi:hypothetical protein
MVEELEIKEESKSWLQTHFKALIWFFSFFIFLTFCIFPVVPFAFNLTIFAIVWIVLIITENIFKPFKWPSFSRPKGTDWPAYAFILGSILWLIQTIWQPFNGWIVFIFLGSLFFHIILDAILNPPKKD